MTDAGRARLVAQWRARWLAFAPRERRAIAVAAGALLALLVWFTLVLPAWRTVREAPAQLDRLDAELQQLQRSAAEARELRGAAPVAPAQAAAALEAAAAQLGGSGRLMVQGDRATLSLTGASPEALAAWLGEARSAARARPVEAQLTRVAQGYSGSVVVQIGTGP